ncbi:hypothetical protein POSPLADRAFT_1046659 [Postia placenta MAD-698-R-SB12]|uniref:Protein kinase domain-containing protein n=1 Tax=Postia placenta MAD-698-R-SB12 TaxID=670580 RepID=A0A1X6N0Z7_9APHY|nr:hypothetical protein POSPLADRAFT_1046659 [Postia placenta MAD-698-R-SB12]OSX62299.1 hypothetical protein POSPLADRAFT_1046659 [Postia placenta MAD-698-R-SB12]
MSSIFRVTSQYNEKIDLRSAEGRVAPSRNQKTLVSSRAPFLSGFTGYELYEQIGGGGFSTVWRAVHFEDKRVAACKVVLLTPETTQQERKALDKEMRVHTNLKHSNILAFISAVKVEPDVASIYTPGLYMLLEIAAGGDLFDKIAPNIGIGEEMAHYYFLQMMSGLIYMHGEGVCHRDLKPENLLLDGAGVLKISDFGLCSVYMLKESGKTRLLTDRVGSLPYMAPELAIDGPYSAEPIDVWGAGVILYAMLAGNTPWDEPTKRSYEYAQYITGRCFNEAPWNTFGNDVLSLLTGMLALAPSRRMSLGDVCAHPWMIRPSQIARHGLSFLADSLMQSLRATGDLAIANPDISANVDPDGDQIMATAQRTQFTQSLLLFSQTQNGTRYMPQLTRFYTQVGPYDLLPLIQEALTDLGVKWKEAVEVELGTTRDGVEDIMLRMRIGGHDPRRLLFKGWVELEDFSYAGKEGGFCVMLRDQGNPLSWRALWKSVIEHPIVRPHVFFKGS